MPVRRTMKTIVAAIIAGVRQYGRVSAEPNGGFNPGSALRGINKAAKLAGNKMGKTLIVTIQSDGTFDIEPERSKH